MAIKDEVEDLEKAGINVIQIDEAALREGLPLRKSEEAFYLNWAVHSFRITNCGVQDTTQVCNLLNEYNYVSEAYCAYLLLQNFPPNVYQHVQCPTILQRWDRKIHKQLLMCGIGVR